MAKFTKLIKYSKYGIAFSLSALLATFFPSFNNSRSTNTISESNLFNVNSAHADAPWVGDGGGGSGDGGDGGGSGCGDGGSSGGDCS